MTSHQFVTRRSCPEDQVDMAGPSYLGRRGGWPLFHANKVGEIGRAPLRRSHSARVIKDGGFRRGAGRRLVDSLSWAYPLVGAPDLETVGSVLHDRLTTYVERCPAASEALWPNAALSNIRCGTTWHAPTSAVFRFQGRFQALPVSGSISSTRTRPLNRPSSAPIGIVPMTRGE